MGSFILPLWTLILTQKLGMSKSQAGDYFALLTASQGACLLLGGKLADVFGRKPILIFCQTFGALSYILCSLTSPGAGMIAYIVVASDLYTAASPAYDAIVADITAPENRKASFSLLYLGVNVGMTFSPLLGGLLFQNHLPLLFLLDGTTTLASCLIIAFFVHDADAGKRKEAEEGKEELRGKSVFRVLRGIPVLSVFILLCFLYNFCYAQWGFLLPLQFGHLYGESGARLYSLTAALNALVVITCTPPLTRLTSRRKPLLIIFTGGILYSLAFLAFSLTGSLAGFLAANVVFTFGEIVTTINLGAFVANHSPRDCRGRISSVYTFVTGAGSAFGPLVMGRMNFGASYALPWRFTAVLNLTGAFGMLLLNRMETRAEPAAAASDESEKENG